MNKNCETCGANMSRSRDSNNPDYTVWQCTDLQCTNELIWIKEEK